ncbi:MAG: DMT family transporter [Rhodobacteraceae bacterium]|nr:DMT family transporter [Paracoccaceae bacterium]
MPKTAHMQGHLAMLLFAVFVSGSFSLGGYVARLVDPAALMALRFLLAGVLIGALVAIGPGVKRRDLQAPWRYFILGGLFASYFVLMFMGLRTADPLATSAVFTLTPVMSAGFGWILMRQITTKRMGAALVIGGIGALWVIFKADFNAFMAFEIGYGESLFFLGCISHAIFTPLSRKLNRGEAPLVFTLGVLVAGFIVLAIYSAPEIIKTDWRSLPLILWLVLGYLVVFASAATFFLLQYSTLRLPSAKVMAYTYLVPVFVIIWQGALGFGWPDTSILMGVGLIVFALYLLLRE